MRSIGHGWNKDKSRIGVEENDFAPLCESLSDTIEDPQDPPLISSRLKLISEGLSTENASRKKSSRKGAKTQRRNQRDEAVTYMFLFCEIEIAVIGRNDANDGRRRIVWGRKTKRPRL